VIIQHGNWVYVTVHGKHHRLEADSPAAKAFVVRGWSKKGQTNAEIEALIRPFYEEWAQGGC